MSYYDTVDDDLKRAKEILAKGKEDYTLVGANKQSKVWSSATIYGADTYAAYKLLESFITEIERQRREALTITCPLCPWSARNEVEGDAAVAARIQHHLQLAFVDHVRRAHPG